MTMPYHHAHNLYVDSNHLALRLSPGPWLVDTGSDKSFGEAPVLHLEPNPREVPESHNGLRVADINRVTNGVFVGLIGNDILGTNNILFDLKEKNSSRGYAQCFGTTVPEPHGRRVDLEFVKDSRIPIVTALVGVQRSRVIFDTGAQYSYLRDIDGLGAKPAGKSTDFVQKSGGLELFDVDLYELPVSLGGIVAPMIFATEPGHSCCPPAVEKLLEDSKTDGIIGFEILHAGKITYLPGLAQIWL